VRSLSVITIAAVFIPGLATPCWAEPPPGDAGSDVPAGPIPIPAAPPSEPHGLARWYNPATAPFIPVPEIAVDPDSGTTFGIIPTWVHTDENHNVTRIIAPDVLYNPYFGFGVHGRIYAYTSADEQWSVVAGIKERVERGVDLEYQVGRLRDGRWSISYSLVFDRDGTPRFYGIGNDTPEAAQTNYTNQQDLAQVQVGLNITHAWQLLYTARLQVVDVLPGSLNDVPSIQTVFPNILGLGTNKDLLNRLSLVYDTRDDITVPSKGVKWVLYGGVASANVNFNDSAYTEAGVDGRGFWPICTDTVLVAHGALRYLPGSRPIPFWQLSSLGGGQSEIGGEQPLRGYGAGRFYDRDSVSTSVEVRRRVFSFDSGGTNLDIQVAPFMDLGRVFHKTSTFPLDQLHQVYGLGFRGIARPFVVGYVDLGYGTEGVAVFTGLNYPF
jgi:hypothetical protein